jgi:hypothetical protein
MKTRKVVFVACWLGVLAPVSLVVWTIWFRPQADIFPRPTDAGFIEWLDGEEITDGLQVWRIQKGDVCDFEVFTITDNPEGIYTATVSFRAIAKGSGIHAEAGLIRYKRAVIPTLKVPHDQIELVDFVPVYVIMPRLSARARLYWQEKKDREKPRKPKRATAVFGG